MSVILRRPPTQPSPSNRVSVYVVTNEAKVRQVLGATNRYLAGAYLPRAGASIAIVPKLKGARSKYDMSGETILYHEYAHHFLWTLTARTFPRWFIEGFAEYFASVKFKSDGSIVFGVPATHRAAELAYSRDVPIRTLLEFDGGAGLGDGLGDELTALTGGGSGRARPVATVNAIPEPGEPTRLRIDQAVDRELLEKIIKGVEDL